MPVVGQIERIRVFIEVASARSFAAAARQLNISRSVATRHVGDLEADLGVQLLVRTTRSVSLTLAGENYLERVLAITRDLDRTNESAREQQNSLTGTLRVSAPLSLGLRFLPDVIAQFTMMHPGIALKLDLSDRFIDILSEDYDMALRVSGPPGDKSTIWRKICLVPRVLVATPVYLERKGMPLEPAQLLDHDCLGYSHFSGGNELQLENSRSGISRTVRAHHPFLCNNGEMMTEMALRDCGIALLPMFIVAKHLAGGALQTVLDDWSAPPIWLTAYYPPYDILPAKVQTLTDYIEGAVSDRKDAFTLQ